MKTNDIYKSVERLGELLKVGARQIGAKYGLQPVQLEVLHYLTTCNRFSDTTMAVAEYLGQTKGTVSQTIKVLENKELIIKVADSKDKRISHLHVTDHGQTLIDENLPTHFFNNACNSLSNQQQTEIAASLQQLLVTIVGTSDIKSFGVCRSCVYNDNKRDGYYCKLLKVPLTDDDVTRVCKEHEPAV